MPSSLKPAPALVVSRSAIVNQDRTASWEFVKILQNWSTQIANSLNQLGQLIGTISANAVISGRSEGIGTTVQNIDSHGVVQPAGVTPATDVAQGAVVLPTGAPSNLLGSAALKAVSWFDPAGAAAAAQSNAETFATNAANTAQSNAEAFSSNASNLTSGTVPNARLAGISGSVTLAKLTVSGTNGSLTFTNGLITAVVAPS